MRKAPITLCVWAADSPAPPRPSLALRGWTGPSGLWWSSQAVSLGRGLAYGAHHPLHLLNVRTRDLSVRAGQPGDFLNWAFRQLDQGETTRACMMASAILFCRASCSANMCASAFRGGGGEARR